MPPPKKVSGINISQKWDYLNFQLISVTIFGLFFISILLTFEFGSLSLLIRVWITSFPIIHIDINSPLSAIRAKLYEATYVNNQLLISYYCVKNSQFFPDHYCF